MTRYYFTVHFLPHGADERLLVGRCIRVLHGFLIENDIAGIGVTFPAWSLATIGKYTAFVSDDKIALQFLRSQQYFKMMMAEGFFDISGIEMVPSDCNEVRFKRNQRTSKLNVNGKRRRLERARRRAEARGEDFISQEVSTLQTVGPFHGIFMNSNSNGHQFMLNVQKEVNAGESCSTYNSYGLATNVDYRGTVPDLVGVG